MRVLLIFLLLCSPVLAQTKQGVIYATASGILRRVIVPDNDAQLSDPSWVKAGETMTVTSRGVDPIAAVTTATGKAPPNATCNVMSGLTIVAQIQCDPALDTLPGFTLQLVTPLAVAPAVIKP